MRRVCTLLGAAVLSMGCINTCQAQGTLVESLIKAFSGGSTEVKLEAPAEETNEESATHKEIKTISIKGEAGKLQTLAATPDGKIVALVSSGRYAPPTPDGDKKASAEIHLLDADGEEIRTWKLDFHGQSVGVDPKGNIYVAGDGQVARYSQDGKQLAKAEVPHITEVLGDQDKLRKQAEEQITAQNASYQRAIDQMKEQIKAVEDKGDEATDLEKQQADGYRVNLKLYEQLMKQREEQSVDSVMQSLTGRLRIINSITATDTDVFIACGELKGYGYAVWRMDHEFKNPEQVMSKIGGCCGQMDVQASGKHLFVAENTKHRVGQYDRAGDFVTSFGKRDRVSAGECFAGCCNPMNCRVTSSGDVYTAESEGIIKKFNAKGEFVAFIGKAKLSGGCKNVAVAASPSGDKVYFCDLPGSRLIILGEKKDEVAVK